MSLQNIEIKYPMVMEIESDISSAIEMHGNQFLSTTRGKIGIKIWSSLMVELRGWDFQEFDKKWNSKTSIDWAIYSIKKDIQYDYVPEFAKHI